MSNDLFDSSDSVRHARPLKYAQYVTFDEPLELELGEQLPQVTVAYETYGRLNAKGDNAVLICHALSGDSHVAQHDDADDPGWWDIVVGPGKCDRHRPLLRHLPEHSRRMPRHHRTEQHQSPDRPALCHRFSRDYRGRHRRSAAAADRSLGHRPAARGRRRIAGRKHGADLGHALRRSAGRRNRGRHLGAADQPGHGLRRRRPQRHPSRSGLSQRAILRIKGTARWSVWPSRACWDTSPISRAKR